jgi:divalent metal cation (Fe/Co/Zn/Cd) transporter
VTSVYAELALVALGAMLSPTTLTFAVLALVLGDRPLRTGLWFYLGALGATLAVGVIAAFVLGNAAASHPSSAAPKTWVCVVDIAAAVALLAYVARAARRPSDPARIASMTEQMSRVSSSPAIAIVGAGAALANPGGFIPLALKDISQLDPNAGQYILLWLAFALVSLLPLLVAIVMLAVRPDQAQSVLARAREWLERRARTVAGVILVVLAVALLRNGIVGLT